MKKYTKKIMAMVTVAATMVTGTAIPVMADDAPTIRLITWLTPSNPAQKPSYDAIMQMNLPWNTKILLEMS